MDRAVCVFVIFLSAAVRPSVGIPCSNPRAVCMGIRDCAPFITFLESMEKPLRPPIVSFLRSQHCGFVSGYPKVCCANVPQAMPIASASMAANGGQRQQMFDIKVITGHPMASTVPYLNIHGISGKKLDMPKPSIRSFINIDGINGKKFDIHVATPPPMASTRSFINIDGINGKKFNIHVATPPPMTSTRSFINTDVNNGKKFNIHVATPPAMASTRSFFNLEGINGKKFDIHVATPPPIASIKEFVNIEGANGENFDIHLFTPSPMLKSFNIYKASNWKFDIKPSTRPPINSMNPFINYEDVNGKNFDTKPANPQPISSLNEFLAFRNINTKMFDAKVSMPIFSKQSSTKVDVKRKNIGTKVSTPPITVSSKPFFTFKDINTNTFVTSQPFIIFEDIFNMNVSPPPTIISNKPYNKFKANTKENIDIKVTSPATAPTKPYLNVKDFGINKLFNIRVPSSSIESILPYQNLNTVQEKDLIDLTMISASQMISKESIVNPKSIDVNEYIEGPTEFDLFRRKRAFGVDNELDVEIR